MSARIFAVRMTTWWDEDTDNLTADMTWWSLQVVKGVEKVGKWKWQKRKKSFPFIMAVALQSW